MTAEPGGAYFDGDTPDVLPPTEFDSGADYAWTGADELSASTYTRIPPEREPTDLAMLAGPIIARLEAAGIRAVVDIRDANPPCVQLRPPTLNYRFRRGCVGADWTALVMVPDQGMHQTFMTLGAFTDRVQAALDYRPPQAVPTDVTLPDGGVVPAYQLTWTETT